MAWRTASREAPGLDYPAGGSSTAAFKGLSASSPRCDIGAEFARKARVGARGPLRSGHRQLSHDALSDLTDPPPDRDPVPAPGSVPEPANEYEESTAEVLARADAWARAGRVYDAMAVYRALALRLDWERGRLEAELERRVPLPAAAGPAVEAPSPQRTVTPMPASAPSAGAVAAPPVGLIDRRQLEAFVAEQPDATLTMLIVDVDRLQRINDGWSREVGDAVLARCVQLLRAQSRPQDILTRLGGAQFAAAFVVIFGGPVSLTRATLVAERLRAAIEREDWSTIAAGLVVTASVGVAACAPGEALDGALARAHGALAECKRTGRNQVRGAS